MRGINDHRKLLCVVGTRPEGIKMAPVIRQLRSEGWADVRVMATAQHREMLDQVLAQFEILVDIDLDIMQVGQSLASLTARMIEKVNQVLGDEAPDLVIAQGDTTTVFAIALCCFYREIPFAHVEAGLRTHDRKSPFPEEMNRVVASYLADLHFAPTARARDNLLKEGVEPDRVMVTGNTVIDALFHQSARNADIDLPIQTDKRLILVTVHRRESFGKPLGSICDALLELCSRRDDIEFLLPVHPNPIVSGTIRSRLTDQRGIVLCNPLDYAQFVGALKRAYIILTDSGGVQEEAPALGKPVLVLRAETERPEAIEAGVARLVGMQCDQIVDAVTELLDNPASYGRMVQGGSPFGDGHAAPRISHALKSFLLAQGQNAG
ncbi:non-hydrolyzing UDP-N-acetylglucosamine 2-epimerase [Dokdonella sp.]|uniref:non-hydrolyzing UDP-N-acetylglucosamine 2-epimerase n=1 Tax=Dokdonella sp. TaxID=2291710 RepID=UPI003528CBFF